MKLPIQSGPAGAWQMYDFGRKWVTSTAAAGGTATAVVGTVPLDELWLIDWVRVSAETDTTVRAYLCLDAVDRDVMGTSYGNYDVADQNSAIHAPEASQVLVVWRDMPDGEQGRAYLQWTVMKRVSGEA